MMRHGLEARGQSLDFNSQSSTKILTLIVIIQITPPPHLMGGGVCGLSVMVCFYQVTSNIILQTL
jgi:hypothetical protein